MQGPRLDARELFAADGVARGVITLEVLLRKETLLAQEHGRGDDSQGTGALLLA